VEVQKYKKEGLAWQVVRSKFIKNLLIIIYNTDVRVRFSKQKDRYKQLTKRISKK